MDRSLSLISPAERLAQLAWLFVIEGQVAAAAGLSSAINPYCVGSLQSDRWIDGWLTKRA
jgi:hypothetical protein